MLAGCVVAHACNLTLCFPEAEAEGRIHLSFRPAWANMVQGQPELHRETPVTLKKKKKCGLNTVFLTSCLVPVAYALGLVLAVTALLTRLGCGFCKLKSEFQCNF